LEIELPGLGKMPFTVQLILRHYQTLSEVLHGFDVDCCAVAYWQSKYYCTDRAWLALSTRTNTVNVQLLSPTYESRLQKYKWLGFNWRIPGVAVSESNKRYLRPQETSTIGYARLEGREYSGRSENITYDGHRAVKRISVRYLDDNERHIVLLIDDRGIYGYCCRNYDFFFGPPKEVTGLKHLPCLVSKIELEARQIDASQFTGSFQPIYCTWQEWLNSGFIQTPPVDLQLEIIPDKAWQQEVIVDADQVETEKILAPHNGLVIVERKRTPRCKRSFYVGLTPGQTLTRELVKPSSFWEWKRVPECEDIEPEQHQ